MTETVKIHICTSDNPWTREKSKCARHNDAVPVGEQSDGWPSGDIQRYRCPHCNHTFDVELPQ